MITGLHRNAVDLGDRERTARGVGVIVGQADGRIVPAAERGS